MLKKILISIFLGLMLPHFATGLDINTNNIETKPETTNMIIKLNSTNETHENISFDVTGLPFLFNFSDSNFNMTNETKNVTMSVGIPNNFDSGNYTGSLITETKNDTYNNDFSIFVKEEKTWNVTNSDFINKTSVGSTSKYGFITLENNGNVKADLNIEIEGNISEYLLFESNQRIYPSINKNVTFEYQIPKTTDFGNYTGNLSLNSDTKNKTLNLSTRFVDLIKPELRNQNFPSFMATTPKNFTLEARDNIKVDEVKGQIFYTDEVLQGNSTVKVNKTYDTLDFIKINNTNKWTVKPKSEKIDKFFVNGTIKDESNNTIKFNDSYLVEGLNITQVEKSLDLKTWRVNTEHTKNIGSMAEDRELVVELSKFSENLTDYQIGIENNNNKNWFYSDDKTVTISQKGDINLIISSSELGKFNGKIEYHPIDQHIEIQPTSFNGKFVNYTPPEDVKYTIGNKVYECDAHPSSALEESYWNCKFKVFAKNINDIDDFENELTTIVPRSFKENIIENKNKQIQRAEQRADFNFKVMGVSLFLLFIMMYLFFVIEVYGDKAYYSEINDTDEKVM